MRHFLIDTDTASDDAIAILMALREPSINVEAITVVAGNCPLDVCVRNALITVEKANTYAPPVYVGRSAPMLRSLITAEIVHGQDGMGDMNLPDPMLKPTPGHAVNAIIDTARRFPGELEVVTLGPLTNLALALLMEPKLENWIKRVYVMGGGGLGPGNMSPVAEFNFMVDAEAVHVLLSSKVPKSIVGWDVCQAHDAYIHPQDIERLKASSELGRFAVRCNETLIQFNLQLGHEGFDLPDPTTVAAALYPEMVTRQFEAYTYVDHQSDKGYGQFVVDFQRLTTEEENATIVAALDGQMFKDKLIELLADQ